MTGQPEDRPTASEIPTAPERVESAATSEKPPLGSWPRMYALVLGVLVLEIILFSLFTQAFR